MFKGLSLGALVTRTDVNKYSIQIGQSDSSALSTHLWVVREATV